MENKNWEAKTTLIMFKRIYDIEARKLLNRMQLVYTAHTAFKAPKKE